MKNNTLIGQSVITPDQQSEPFIPNQPITPDQPITPGEPDPKFVAVEPEETDNTKNLIMYIGAGLLLYLFVFKKK